MEALAVRSTTLDCVDRSSRVRANCRCVVGVLVDLQRVNIKEPDRFLLKELSLTVSGGDRLEVVGVNGTGKSTLLRVLAGRLDPDNGPIHRSRTSRIEFLEQRPQRGSGNVRSVLGEGWESASALDRLEARVSKKV